MPPIPAMPPIPPIPPGGIAGPLPPPLIEIKSSIFRIMFVASVADLMTCCFTRNGSKTNSAHVNDFACGEVDAEGFAICCFVFGSEGNHDVYGV